ERLEPADDDGVRARIGPDRIDRLLRGDAEPLALTWGEPPVAGMPSELHSVFVHDRAFLRVEPAPFEEGAVIVARKEARLLAFSAPRGCEGCALGLGTRLSLRLLAEGERDPVELPRIEAGQHVRLVLVGI